jgi:NADPH:quinone reductase-like Zn-dependent oxidoreductase
MKAAVYREYGAPEVVRIEDIPKPVAGDNDVVVRIVASTLCSADWRLRRPSPPPMGWVMNGFSRPKKINVLGMEFAGTVDSVGPSVTGLKIGDRVFGASWRFGAHAEYACFPERSVARIPDGVGFGAAAAIPYGGITALHFLRLAGIAAGQNVLIRGASGSVGSAAVQLAKHFGARVTGVCSSGNVELVRSIGADTAVDYKHEDFARAGRVYDIVQDTIGGLGYRRARRALKPGGTFVDAGPGFASAVVGPWLRATGQGNVVGTVAKGGREALDFLAGLVAEGRFKPVIERHYGLGDIVAAHRHAEAGHKKGNLVIDIAMVPRRPMSSQAAKDG